MAWKKLFFDKGQKSYNFALVFGLAIILINPFMISNLGIPDNTDNSNNLDGVENEDLIMDPDSDTQLMNQAPEDNKGSVNIEKVDDNYFGLSSPTASSGFQYPKYTSIIPMGNSQDQIQRRTLYKELFGRIYSGGGVELVMDPFNVGTTTYPAGTLLSMYGFGGDFNSTYANQSFNITKAYSLHPRKIAVLKSDVLDSYGQNVTWEEGYFERIFRVYLWGDYFNRINETNIKNDALENYDVLILPSIMKGYEKSVVKKLGNKGLNNIKSFVDDGNVLYAQSGSCYLAEAAKLVPDETVLLDTRINANYSHADMVAVDSSYPMVQGWLSNKMYVIDDPVLNNTNSSAVVAKYTGNLTNSSLLNTPSIMNFKSKNGEVILINGHPSVNSDFYPIFFSAMFFAMAETVDLRAVARQIYNPEVPANMIPAQEANVTVQVEVTYRNFWPVDNCSPRMVQLRETISPMFRLDPTNVTPKQTDVVYIENVSSYWNHWNLTGIGTNETVVIWNFTDIQGIKKFVFNVKTYENSTKKGIVPICKGVARFKPPGFRGLEEIHHGWVYISAALAANLVGDRDIELDGCYPLRWSGEYFDIALPLENKEGTTAKNITIVDIVCLQSPLVDVENQSRLVDPVGYKQLCLPIFPIFVNNTVFFYFDENNKSLYPLPDEMHNTTYNYTMWNGTNLTLPALKLVWHIEDLVGYDYLEPAIRYGIYSREQFNRTITFKSDPKKGSLVMNASGGSVFTNLGIHPVPYREYLSHDVVTIPKGEEVPRVDYDDIWNRNKSMKLRTVFYDIVPFPPPEEHMVVTTTFEMKYNDKRMMEFPIHHDVDLNFKLKTWNGYGKYDPKTYPYHMNITKNETMIVQAIPRGVGYNIDYIKADFNKNTSLLMIHNTSTHSILYFQQDIAGGHKEVIDINARLSAYPQVHREGTMKINDGARFVYHQIAVGPSRYEVFDSHVQAVFAIGNDVKVEKKVAPVYIATFGDDVYHFIELEDPYEPREFMEDPYIKSHGFGDMAATTYVGGRINETIYHSRVSPGGRTLMRLEIDNNLGVDLNNVTIKPVAPDGFNVTLDTFTSKIPPIFFDFPFINRTDIWDAWKAVYYYWVDIDQNVTGGKVYTINFTFESNCSNASYLPSGFDIPGGMIGVKDKGGHVEAIFGRAVNVKLSDTVTTPIVRPEDIRILNVEEKEALELLLATGVAAPGLYNRSIVNDSYQSYRGCNFTNKGSGVIDVDLPSYAQMIPWIDNNTNRKTMYVIIRTNVTVNRGGAYVVNKGPAVSYVNHFNETVKINGNNEYIEAHGPAFYYKMSVMKVESNNILHSYLMGGENNTLSTRITCYNYGDDIAESSTVQITIPPTVVLDISSLPVNTKYKGNMIYWTLGDLGPGSLRNLDIVLFATPPAINKTLNRGPPEPWLLVESTQATFIHSYLQKPIYAQSSDALFGYLFDSDLALTQLYYSHPFAATNVSQMVYVNVRNNWQFSEAINDIQVNFSVNGLYAGSDIIPTLVPGQTAQCKLELLLTQEGTYDIKAEIVAPQLHEFLETNNEIEGQLIVVDPITLTGQPDFGTGKDTFIANLDPKLSFGDEDTLKVGRVSSAGGYGSGIGVSRSMLKFDTSGIPKNAIILDAEIQLYMHKSNGGDQKISSYQLVESWSETGATWDIPPMANGTAMDTVSVGTTAGYVSWDVTDAATAWVANPTNNYGLLMQSDQETKYWWKEFYSSDVENGLRPKLIVHFAMLKNTPNVKTATLTITDYKESELRLEWTPVPYTHYYEIFKATNANGPYQKLGTTYESSTMGGDGCLDVFFYDDVDGGYPEPPVTINTDRGGLPGTIRVQWSAAADPSPAPAYYYRIKCIGIENKVSSLSDSPTTKGQLTPTIEKYMVYNSTSSSGPWDTMLGETTELSFNHGGLGQGTIMFYKIKSKSSEGYISGLSKTVWGRSNQMPSINNLEISPATPYTTDYLEAKYTFSDVDGDTESGSLIRWYRNGNLLTGYNDRIKVYPGSTKKDQVWHYTVNPKDGIEFGSGASSGKYTIKNSAPRLYSFSITPSTPTTLENLTLKYTFYDADYDIETATKVRWFKDGIHQPTYDNQKQVPASASSKHEAWNASIGASDGTDFSTWVSTSKVTILNSAPTASGVKISPANPKTNEVLSVVYTYADADSDTETKTSIQWYRDDNMVSAYSNSLTIPASATYKGERWYVTVTPNDGEKLGEMVQSSEIKIDNTIPKILSANIIPQNPKSVDELIANYSFYDADSDWDIGSEIRWFRNSELFSNNNDKQYVSAEHTKRDDVWYYTIKPSDGFGFGDIFTSQSIMILNSPPEILTVQLTPVQPALSDDLEVSYEYSDPDQDKEADVNIRWYRDNQLVPELNDLTELPSRFTNGGEVWHCGVQGYDGFEFSSWASSLEVKVNTPPTAIDLVINPEQPTTVDKLTASYQWQDSDSSDYEVGTIIQWFRNSEQVKELANLMEVDSEFTQKGQSWYFEVKPCDGLDSGSTVRSVEVMIGNTPPEATELVIEIIRLDNIELQASYQYSDLDSDLEDGSIIKWYKNGVLVPELNGEWVVPMTFLVYGDLWQFSLQPSDGKSMGELSKSSVIQVQETELIVGSVILTPEQAKTSDKLAASITYLDESSSQSLRTVLKWYKDDVEQGKYLDWETIPVEGTAKGEEWYFSLSVIIYDKWSPPMESNHIVIMNTEPIVEDLQISPERPGSTQSLTLEYTYIDADHDMESDTEIHWFRDGVHMETLDGSKEVTSEMLVMGEEWYCTVTSSDGLDLGELVKSDIVTINTIPEINKLSLSPENPEPGNLITLTYEYYDYDNDIEADTLVQWFRNDELVEAMDGKDTIPEGYSKPKEHWYAVVQPHDGVEYGQKYQSNEITVQDEIKGEADTRTTTESQTTDASWVWLVLLCLFIVIFLVITIALRSRKKPVYEQEPVQLTLDEPVYEEPRPQPEPEPKKEPKQAPAPKQQKMKLSQLTQEFSKKQPVALSYDEIEIEFRCTNCDKIIEIDSERCPNCGEELGSL